MLDVFFILDNIIIYCDVCRQPFSVSTTILTDSTCTNKYFLGKLLQTIPSFSTLYKCTRWYQSALSKWSPGGYPSQTKKMSSPSRVPCYHWTMSYVFQSLLGTIRSQPYFRKASFYANFLTASVEYHLVLSRSIQTDYRLPIFVHT